MKAFWREKPLTKGEIALLAALTLAHEQSATRGNISGVTVENAVVGSGSYVQAIAAGILTLGGMHAPLAATMAMLRVANPPAAVQEIIRQGVKVPGWGNSFVRGGKDELWQPVEAALEKTAPVWMRAIERVTHELHKAGKNIFPNPSAYNAAVALAVQMPPEIAPFLFIQARLPAWTQIALTKL